MAAGVTSRTAMAIGDALVRECGLRVPLSVLLSETPLDVLGVNVEEATSLTKGLIFTDHRTGDLVPAHLFLSGNVRRKAAELEELAKDDPEKWGEAAAAMRAAVPPDKDVTKISAKLGMVWIPADDVETFVRDITGNDRATVTYSEEDGWKCSPANGGSRRNPALEGGGSMGAPPGHDWRKPLKRNGAPRGGPPTSSSSPR